MNRFTCAWCACSKLPFEHRRVYAAYHKDGKSVKVGDAVCSRCYLIVTEGFSVKVEG